MRFGLGYLGLVGAGQKRLPAGQSRWRVFGVGAAQFIGASTAGGTLSAAGSAAVSFISGSPTLANTIFNATGAATVAFVGSTGGGFTAEYQFNDARNSMYLMHV